MITYLMILMNNLKNCEWCYLGIVKSDDPESHCITCITILERKSRYSISSHGICRFCARRIKRMRKTGKHLLTHYMSDGRRCKGSRKLDFYNRKLIIISEGFDSI